MIAGLLLFMPFVAVSCEAPGGFGRAAPGGTTTYTGMDLVTGGTPEVSPADKVREGPHETVPAQPMAIIALLLITAGVVVTLVVGQVLIRRAVATILAGLAALALTVNQLTVQSLLIDRVQAQLTVAIPAGKQTADFVRTQSGFWLCVITLIVLVMVYGAGWIRNTTRE